jgi:hypothetical protein
MQELSVFAGHLDVYSRGTEIIEKMLRVSSSSATIYRVSDYYGQQLEKLLDEPVEARPIDDDQVVYVEIDGSMIFTDKQWREVKLARVFRSDEIKDSAGDERGQSIEHSEYTAHLGGHEAFVNKLNISTDKYADLGKRLVFINDGARWIEQYVSRRYPQATRILDFYHAVEYLGGFAQVAFGDANERSRWVAAQKALLLAGRVESVIDTVAAFEKEAPADVKEQAQRVTGYYRANRDRMRYDEYIKRGLSIGSGAIESAHRTVVQRRMKLSGQRWTNPGAEHMLNLRVCSLSGKWNLLEDLIKHQSPIAA